MIVSVLRYIVSDYSEREDDKDEDDEEDEENAEDDEEELYNRPAPQCRK